MEVGSRISGKIRLKKLLVKALARDGALTSCQVRPETPSGFLRPVAGMILWTVKYHIQQP